MDRRRLVALAAIAGLILAACSEDKEFDPGPAMGSARAVSAPNIAADPKEVPGPVGERAARRLVVDITTEEVEGRLADGASYSYWTFGGTVPGPMLRVRVGDTVELRLKNSAKSSVPHSIDLHAVTGPGGGAVATQTAPGEQNAFTFKAMNPGLYVYHCATPPIDVHVANGMYGLILVEPEGGLTPVDREFYVVQGEIYADGERGDKGRFGIDSAALPDENPTYVVFNGSFQALTGKGALEARVGDRVRIFFGNGGPDLASNFHVIGEIFDAVHAEGGSEATHNVQTTLVPAGGAAWVEFQVDVPGTYLLVDHALSRTMQKGSLGQLVVKGPANPEVFRAPAAR